MLAVRPPQGSTRALRQRHSLTAYSVFRAVWAPGQQGAQRLVMDTVGGVPALRGLGESRGRGPFHSPGEVTTSSLRLSSLNGTGTIMPASLCPQGRGEHRRGFADWEVGTRTHTCAVTMHLQWALTSGA